MIIYSAIFVLPNQDYTLNYRQAAVFKKRGRVDECSINPSHDLESGANVFNAFFNRVLSNSAIVNAVLETMRTAGHNVRLLFKSISLV